MRTDLFVVKFSITCTRISHMAQALDPADIINNGISSKHWLVIFAVSHGARQRRSPQQPLRNLHAAI
jgi:hypothetical protein